MTTTTMSRNGHAGPNPGIVAIIYTLLFNAGLYFVISFRGPVHLAASGTAVRPYFPGPWESAQTIATYFQGHPSAVLMCAFLQFGAAIPLGLFTATMVSRLLFLGVRAAGAHIALFGGMMAAFDIAISALVLWVMAYPGVAQETGVLRALYYMVFSIGAVDDYEADAQMADRVRADAWRDRRVERAKPGDSESALSYSADAIPQFHLADTGRIQIAQEHRGGARSNAAAT